MKTTWFTDCDVSTAGDLHLRTAIFNESVTSLQSVVSAALHNGEDEGQLIMYSVRVCCFMAEHKRSLCACLPPEPGRIPQLLLDTAAALSEEAPDGPAAPQQKDLTELPVDLQEQTGDSSHEWPLTHADLNRGATVHHQSDSSLPFEWNDLKTYQDSNLYCFV